MPSTVFSFDPMTLALGMAACALVIACVWLSRRVVRAETALDALGAHSRNLEATLDTMSQGVALFDSHERILVSNSAFATMYGMAPSEVAPGTSLRAILEARASRGIYTGTTVDAILKRLRERLSRKSVTHWTAPFADGRTIVVSTQPRPDGSWVNTHLDITERERLREQLDAALESMIEGIAMFDADRKLVLSNAQYADIYKIPAASITAGTSLRDIIQLGKDAGTLSGDEVERFDAAFRCLDKDARSARQRIALLDGRFVDVTVTRNARGGIVTCHRDVTDQCLSDARIAHMALHDTLTGLPNRVLLRERLEQAMARAQRSGESVALHALDLDHFKKVNDTMGHPVGDKLLTEVAGRLTELVRATDTVARLGGDEFAIVQVGITGPHDAAILAERVIKVLSAPFHIGGRDIVIGASVGIAMAPTNAPDFDMLMRHADVALYRSKEAGRGRLCYFESAMDDELRQRREFERDFRDAVRAGAFELHYQPLYSAPKSTITGFEALVRWRHPVLGLVAPLQFIPLAERSGLIHDLGAWVLREACETAIHWPDDIRIAVNVSPVQLQGGTFIEVVERTLKSTGLAPSRLELELTEAALLEVEAAEVLKALRGLGVRLALDDFGAGFSGFANLNLFHFDRIKIDRSFVQGGEGRTGGQLLRGIAQLAQALGVDTTAEGIETEAQMQAVLGEGCSELQGFYLASPVTAQEIGRILLSQASERRHERASYERA